MTTFQRVPLLCLIVVAVLCLATPSMAKRHTSHIQHVVCEDSQCAHCQTVRQYVPMQCVDTPHGHSFRVQCRGHAALYEVFPPKAPHVSSHCAPNVSTLETPVPSGSCQRRGDKYHKLVCEHHRHASDVLALKHAHARVHPIAPKQSSKDGATPSFSVCSAAGALLQNTQISSPDKDWQPGQTVSVVLSGTMSSQVNDGTVSTVAYFGGIKVKDQTDDFCTYTGTPFKCPLAAGAYSVTIPFQVPSAPWADTLTATITMKEAGSNAQITCINFSIDLPDPPQQL